MWWADLQAGPCMTPTTPLQWRGCMTKLRGLICPIEAEGHPTQTCCGRLTRSTGNSAARRNAGPLKASHQWGRLLVSLSILADVHLWLTGCLRRHSRTNNRPIVTRSVPPIFYVAIKISNALVRASQSLQRQHSFTRSHKRECFLMRWRLAKGSQQLCGPTSAQHPLKRAFPKMRTYPVIV